LACVAAAFFALSVTSQAAFPARAAEAPWLLVSDIHLDISEHDREPNALGRDSNVALLRSALAAMKAADPDPPVVVIGGDFLAHSLDRTAAAATFETIERGFAATFPHAQFALAFGNNDGQCGDYEAGFDTPLAAAVARMWAPLVDRGGSAPEFARTFAHDGFARVRLPRAHLTLLTIDDTYWTPRYIDACKSGAHPDAVLSELRRAIDTGPRDERYWILMHVPPGVDAYSTHFSRGLVDVPFLRPSFRRDFVALAASGRVTFALAAHSHKFAYRVVGAGGPHPFPAVLIPALSPIFRNRPAFLTMRVRPDATVSDVREHAFDGTGWRDIGGLPTLGVDAVTSDALLDLSRRLEHDATLRATFARLYDAGGLIEIDDTTWQLFVCAATELDSKGYRRCTGRFGFDPLSPRGVAFGLAALALAAALLAGAFFFVRSRLRTVRRSASGP
jgi:hypothetical protein